MNQIITQRIDNLIDSLLPYGVGAITETKLRTALEQVGQLAYGEGQSQALLGLMTTDDMASRLGVSVRRVRALAASRQVGWQASRGTWIFRPEDVELLRPGNPGRKSRK